RLRRRAGREPLAFKHPPASALRLLGESCKCCFEFGGRCVHRGEGAPRCGLCWLVSCPTSAVRGRGIGGTSASYPYAHGGIPGLRRSGLPVCHEREPIEVLDEFKRVAAQYQQEPVAEGGNLIKWDWFLSGSAAYRKTVQRAFQLFGLRGAADQGRNGLGAGRRS